MLQGLVIGHATATVKHPSLVGLADAAGAGAGSRSKTRGRSARRGRSFGRRQSGSSSSSTATAKARANMSATKKARRDGSSLGWWTRNRNDRHRPPTSGPARPRNRRWADRAALRRTAYAAGGRIGSAANKSPIGYGPDDLLTTPHTPITPAPGTLGEGRGGGPSPQPSPAVPGEAVILWWCDGPCGAAKAALPRNLVKPARPHRSHQRAHATHRRRSSTSPRISNPARPAAAFCSSNQPPRRSSTPIAAPSSARSSAPASNRSIRA